jgi:large subunit ribosomal protein L19
MDLVQDFERTQIAKPFPDIRPGDTVRVHQKIKEIVVSAAKSKAKKETKEEKERIQVFEGVVIQRRGGKGLSGTITVRKIASGVGVEKIFPIYSPTIVKIEVVKRGKVRRAKLFYLRKKKEKEARLKEEKLTKQMLESLVHEKTDVAKSKEVKKEKE